jgi:hypothetical protein
MTERAADIHYSPNSGSRVCRSQKTATEKNKTENLDKKA